MTILISDFEKNTQCVACFCLLPRHKQEGKQEDNIIIAKASVWKLTSLVDNTVLYTRGEKTAFMWLCRMT